MHKTKIIASLGPASQETEVLQALIKNGTDTFRFNMSHANRETVVSLVKKIRLLSTNHQPAIGIMLDTQGPSIRTGILDEKIPVKPGDPFILTDPGYKPEGVSAPFTDTNYDHLVSDLNVGDTILLDNGIIRMSVKEKRDHMLLCETLTEGIMSNHRHINLPGISIKLPSLTEKDMQDIELAIELNVSSVALSFIRTAEDILALKNFLNERGASHITAIAKIETQAAIENIDSIIDAADGILVARGDLGIECPFEELPILQRTIVRKCTLKQKPVIIATHFLESMIQNPIPTRAEVSDIGNAIYEQPDGLMLTGETSSGKYPAECVEVLHRMIRRIEKEPGIGFYREIPITTDKERIIESAVDLANRAHADGICVFTKTGHTARLCAAFRPSSTPIFAFTSSPELLTQLSLWYGVMAFPIALSHNPEETILAAQTILRSHDFIPHQAKLIIVSDILTSTGAPAHSIQLRTLSS